MLIVFFNAVDGFLAVYMLHALRDVDSLLIRMIRDMGGETFILIAFIVGSLFALFLFLHKNFLVARVAIAVVILFQIVTISTQLIIILLFRAT